MNLSKDQRKQVNKLFVRKRHLDLELEEIKSRLNDAIGIKWSKIYNEFRKKSREIGGVIKQLKEVHQ